MASNSLQDLFVTKLQLIYDAERHTLEAMPRLAQQLDSPELQQAFETHRIQTEEQVRRLEQIFEMEGLSPQPQPCLSMHALVQEAEQMLGQIQDPSTRDAFLICAEQAVEHHEIAAYGTARTWAQQLGRQEAADLLQQTLDEEEQTDQLLSDIAESMVNQQATRGDSMRGDRDVTPSAVRGDVADSGGGAGGAPSRRRSTADEADDMGL
jgi:ferritin-like metal-binding protein YciE